MDSKFKIYEPMEKNERCSKKIINYFSAICFTIKSLKITLKGRFTAMFIAFKLFRILKLNWLNYLFYDTIKRRIKICLLLFRHCWFQAYRPRESRNFDIILNILYFLFLFRCIIKSSYGCWNFKNRHVFSISNFGTKISL